MSRLTVFLILLLAGCASVPPDNSEKEPEKPPIHDIDSIPPSNCPF